MAHQENKHSNSPASRSQRINPRRRRLLGFASASVLGGMLPVMRASAATEAGTPVRGGTLVGIAYPEPPTLASHLNGANPISLITSKIYDRLFINDDDGNLVPRLALALDTSKDGLTLTLTLRKGVTWHDGHPFGADDVKYSIEKIWQRSAGGSFDVIDHVTAPDPGTAVLHLKEKWPVLVKYL